MRFLSTALVVLSIAACGFSSGPPPVGDQASPPEAGTYLEVYVEKDGSLRLGDKASSLDTLSDDVLSELGNPDIETLIILAHPEARAGTIIEVRDILSDPEFNELRISLGNPD